MRKPKPNFTNQAARLYKLFGCYYDRFYYGQRDRQAVHDILHAYDRLDPAECASSHAVKRAMRHIWNWSLQIDKSTGDEPGAFLRSCR